mgnify:CR=1 FL=1|jgi:hypothetical protein|tara:strand:- start:48 stop:455 length:408 start_codon:yes stop_codon:yes gene_type:complete
MADAVTSQTIIDGERNCVMKFTNVSDGTGESAVAKVDVSALASNSEGEACSEVRVLRVSHAIVGMSVQLFFDATSNVLFMELAESSNGHMEFGEFGGIPNNAGSGKTGDILFTTKGHSSGDTYSIVLEMTKVYSD